MIHLLWHLRGSVPLDAATSNEAALDRVAAMLEDVALDHVAPVSDDDMPVTERGPDFVAFTPLVGRWHALAMYDRGRVWIDRGRDSRVLRYDLRGLHGFILCLFLGILVFCFGSTQGIAQGIKVGALVFGWLYGVNLLIAIVRVPSLFRRTVAGL